MGQIEALVDRIVALPRMSSKEMRIIVGYSVAFVESGLHWDFYKGTGRGLVSEVNLKMFRSKERWRVSLTMDLALAPQERALDLRRYGPRVSRDVNPDVPPEGIYSYLFNYKERSVDFAFTDKTHRLRDMVIGRD